MNQMTKTQFTKPTGENLPSSVGFNKKNQKNKTRKAKRKQILWWLQEQEGAVFVSFVNKVIL
jgi:hypothetical protein